MGSQFAHIDQLARQLPFGLDDAAAVNDAFNRWYRHPEPNRRTLDLWTYCFVYRYFTLKYVQRSIPNVADFDEIVGATMMKITESRGRLDEGALYANWVSKVCRNNFLNYARRAGKSAVYMDVRAQESLVSESESPVRDYVLLRRELAAAIERLPEYLREPARMRYLQQMDYDDMSAVGGHAVPTLRAYCHKAFQKLKEDHVLHAFFEKWNDDI